MKRMIALILSSLLLLSLIPFAGAAFSDAGKISEQNRTAVDYVSGKNIVGGFPDGTFRPHETLTRAQAAKILCAALEGADRANAMTGTETGFSDVPASHWAARYVAYCAEKQIVAGVGNGRFDPEGKLTAPAFGKMLLAAYRRADPATLVGENWIPCTQAALRAGSLDDGVSVEDRPITRENACRLAYNFLLDEDIAGTEPEAYRETTISFAEPGNYRLLGRAQQAEGGVICDCSADGVEFTADCKGNVRITASVSSIGTSSVTFRVIVDGEPGQQVKLSSVGAFTKTAYLRVLPGVHTIRIVKDFEITRSTDLLRSVTVSCKPETVKPTARKEKMLLVIGDSTSAGFGILGDYRNETTANSASAILTYGYGCAEALDMDYEMIVKGSSGIVKRTGSPEAYNQRELYQRQNAYRAPEESYAFPRKADAVLVKLSGNDNDVAAGEMEAGIRDLVRMVREHNGNHVPILFLYYDKSQHKDLLEKLLAGDPDLYGVKGPANGDGAGNHPSGEAHRIYRDLILDVLRPLMEKA